MGAEHFHDGVVYLLPDSTVLEVIVVLGDVIRIQLGHVETVRGRGVVAALSPGTGTRAPISALSPTGTGPPCPCPQPPSPGTTGGGQYEVARPPGSFRPHSRRG